jgi:hypothetical protein
MATAVPSAAHQQAPPTVSTKKKNQPACPFCGGKDLRNAGYNRPKADAQFRVNDHHNEGEDAVRQRAQCRTCRRYFVLPPLVRLPSGYKKKIRTACDCGSTDLRRRGWYFDGRQHVTCNHCGKQFALSGDVVPVRTARDRLGRRNPNRARVQPQEWVWQWPDPQEEAAALLALAMQNGDFEETRELITVSEMERQVLGLFVAIGIYRSSFVESALKFRSEVLLAFEQLREQAAPLGSA